MLSGGSDSCGCRRKEVNIQSMPKTEGTKIERMIYSGYKMAAKRRKLLFDLSVPELRKLIRMNCYWCGRPPFQVMRDIPNKKMRKYMGIDRLNNDIGYVTDNVVPCCIDCNYAKKDAATEDFKKWVNKVYNTLKKKIRRNKEKHND